MKMATAFALTFVLLCMLGLLMEDPAAAQATSINFSIQGDTGTAPGTNSMTQAGGGFATLNLMSPSSTYTVTVSGNPVTITISQVDTTKAARIDCDPTNELVVLRNAQIKTSSPISDVWFTFSCTFSSSFATASANYQGLGGGVLKASATAPSKSAKIVLRGSGNINDGNGIQTFGGLSSSGSGTACGSDTLVFCVPSTAYMLSQATFAWNNFVGPTTSLNPVAGTHTLQGDFWLTLAVANHFLYLNNYSTTGLQVQGGPPAGAGKDNCKRCMSEGKGEACETCCGMHDSR